MPELPKYADYKEKEFENIKDSYWPKDPLKREIWLTIIFSLVESPKKWTDLLYFTKLSLPRLAEQIREMERAGIVKRKCDAFHLIASREKIYNTLNQALQECEKKMSLLKNLLVILR